MTLPAVLLGAVIMLVLWRPRGLAPAWPALGGALAAGALGLVGLADVARVLGMTWNATAALLGLMLMSAVLEENGLFRAAAHAIARHAGGDGRRLFLGLCALTAVTTTLLANDGAILILTPIVAEMAAVLGFSAAATLAYLFATGFLCDALSTVLPTSNLTNILLVDTLHVPPGRFVAALLAPSLAIGAVGTTALFLQFRGVLPRAFDAQHLGPPPLLSARSLRHSGAALAALAVGYGVAAVARLPLGLVVLAVAAALALAEHASGAVDGRRLTARMPLGIVVFATSLFVCVTALARAGAGRLLGDALIVGHAPLARAGLLVSALTAVGNNLPVLLATLLALKSGGAAEGVPYAALIGANVGSKLTPIGSLATLLWLDLLRRHGVSLGWGRYVALAALPTVAATLAGLAALR
jgi:arsenical pump membrane protein